MKYILSILSTLLCLVFICSCATIFNSKYTTVNIHSNIPCKVIIKEDTSKISDTCHVNLVNRDSKPLKITLFNDSVSKTILVDSKLSFLFYFDLINPCYIVAVPTDLITKRCFFYPEYIDLDLTNNDSSCLFKAYTDKKTWVNSKLPLQMPANTIDSSFISKRHILKFTALKTISIYNTGLELCYEKRINKRFGAQLMAGYLFHRAIWNIDSPRNDAKGFRVALEGKYYIKKTTPAGKYYGIELNYLNTAYTDVLRFSSSRSAHYNTYSDTVHLKKQTLSLNFKKGNQYMRKNFVADYYLGLGIRCKNTIHENRFHPKDVLYYYDTFNYTAEHAHAEGKYLTLSASLNIRVGWCF